MAPIRPALLVLTIAVGLVLLIACVNVANLLLVRIAAREREMAIRRALGAGRARLMRQTLTEGLVLACLGGLGATVVTAGDTRLLKRLGTVLPRRGLAAGIDIPRLDEIGVDGSLFVFALSVSLLVGVLIGVVPALRRAVPRQTAYLREGTASAVSGFNLFRRQGMHGVLVVAEISMAVVLLVGGGLLIHSFVRLSTVDPDYDPTDVLTFEVSLPRDRGAPLRPFADGLVARLQGLPGVRAVGYTHQLSMVQFRSITPLRMSPELPSQLPGPPSPDGGAQPEWPFINYVSRDFLTVMGVRVVAGLAGAAALTRYLEGMLFGLTPLDLATFVAVALLFIVVAVGAADAPARRAMRVDPIIALRAE